MMLSMSVGRHKELPMVPDGKLWSDMILKKKKKNPYALVVKNVDIVLEGVHLSVKIMTFLIVLCVLMSTRI